MTVYRQLAAARPDAFAPDLAASLNNLSFQLADLGRREDALAAIEEAVSLYRQLAAARPDAFAPDLAMALNNLVHLAGRPRPARGRAGPERGGGDPARQLAAARPDAFAPDLAVSLNNLSRRLAAWAGARMRWPRSRKRWASTGCWPPPGPTHSRLAWRSHS